MNEADMRVWLERISEVVGVKGCFVFDAHGRVLAMALAPPPSDYAGTTPPEPEAASGLLASPNVPAPTRTILPAPIPLGMSESSSAALTATALSTVARTAAQTMAGLRSVARRRPGDMVLLFADGRLLIKSLTGGCLCVLCTPGVNLPLVQLTSDATAHKLSALLRERATAAAPPPARAKDQKLAAKGVDRLSSFLRPFSH